MQPLPPEVSDADRAMNPDTVDAAHVGATANAPASQHDAAHTGDRSPSLDLPGAVAADGVWASVPAHYGNPLAEQRALEQGRAHVDLSARGVVRVAGPDRLSWLHSMTTQHLADLAPFTSTETLVLSPHGHVEFALHVVDDGEATWLTTDPGRSAELAAWLRRMQFMLRVEVADVSDEHAVIGEVNDEESTPEQVRETGVIAWRDPWPALGPYAALMGPSAQHPGSERRWRELIVPRERFEAVFAKAQPAGLWAATRSASAAWRPDGLLEVDHRTIPHELDWLRSAVHLQKGCYRGQETVARVHNLGRPPRRLAFVHLDGSDHTLPEVGAEVMVPGAPRAAGRLTSVARHHIDGPIGLVVLKRSTPADAPLLIGGVAAAQTVIVAP